MNVPSQNVMVAQQDGCRCTKYTGDYCCQPVINAPNATMCQRCFQLHYSDLLQTLNRQWCKNHDNGCLSEADDFVPLAGIQQYIPPGKPGGAFQNSGFFMLGWYCAACSLWNVAHSERWADGANEVPVYNKKKKRPRSNTEDLIDQLQHAPNKTEHQSEALAQAKEIHIRLKLREKKLKAEQQALEDTIERLASIIAPTDE